MHMDAQQLAAMKAKRQAAIQAAQTAIEREADGRWAEILQRAGMDPSYLRNKKSGPCPVCPGGTDRYSWSEKYGGVYVCRVCTDGHYRKGIELLMRHLNCSYKEAWDTVRQQLGYPDPYTSEQATGKFVQRPAPAALPARSAFSSDPAKELARMQALWEESVPVTQGDPVFTYLHRRVAGLQALPEQIHLHPGLAYWAPPETEGGRPTKLGVFPAMLVRGFNAVGELVQVHRTYLTEDGSKAPVPYPKKTSVGVGSNAYALRLDMPNGDTLGVAEGIETSLASSLVRGVPVWPCHCASVMANFELPDMLRGQVKKLIIFADSDERKNGRATGAHSAAVLADRMRKIGVKTLITRPAMVGADFADLASSN